MEASSLAALTERIHTWQLGVARAWYAAGRALGEVYARELWRVGGFASFDEYLRDGVDLPRATATKLLRVAASFGPQAGASRPFETLDSAARYLDAAEVEPSDAALATEILVPADDGDRRQPLGDSAPWDIDAARQALDPTPPDPDPPARAAQVVAELLGEGRHLRARHGPDGRLLLSLRDVPAQHLATVLDALARLAPLEGPDAR